MDVNVAAVVVTYNRKKLLLENVKACLSQKRPLNKIIIIDNHSNDGTKEYLFNNIDRSFHNIVDHIYLKENIGGSGGFSYGVDYAFKKGFDFIWLMDDDGRPWDDNTLDNLLKYVSKNNLYNIPVMINSLVQCNDQNLSFGEIQDGKIIYFKNDIKYHELIGHCSLFNGTLISKELVQKIGIPRADYFIKGDEKEYFARTIKNNIFTTTVVNSLYYHPSPIKWDDSMRILGKRIFNNIEAGWKEYYNMRNVCINNILYEKNSKWKNLRFYLIRCMKIIIYSDDKLKLLKAITKAYKHAQKGYTGKYYLPNGEINSAWDKGNQ